VITGAAFVHPCVSTGGWCVDGAGLGGVEHASGWTWSAGAGASDWAWAVGAAIVLALSAVGLVAAVRRTAGRGAGA